MISAVFFPHNPLWGFNCGCTLIYLQHVWVWTCILVPETIFLFTCLLNVSKILYFCKELYHCMPLFFLKTTDLPLNDPAFVLIVSWAVLRAQSPAVFSKQQNWNQDSLAVNSEWSLDQLWSGEKGSIPGKRKKLKYKKRRTKGFCFSQSQDPGVSVELGWPILSGAMDTSFLRWSVIRQKLLTNKGPYIWQQ